MKNDLIEYHRGRLQSASMHISDDALERRMQETARNFHKKAVAWLELVADNDAAERAANLIEKKGVL